MTRRPLSVALQLTNLLLRPLGVRLQRTNVPTRTFADFFDHLKKTGFEANTVIDVGVAHGTPQIYRAFPQADYFLVEPLEEFRPVLEALKRRLNAQCVVAAAGASDGEVALHVHEDLSGSSTFPQAEGPALDGVERRVKTVRLESILPASLRRPALLKIDTQGAELQVLEGLGQRIREVDLIVVEVSLMAFRRGIPTFAETVEALRGMGFAVYDILEGHFRALDSALAQVDVAFVPENSPLRDDPRFFDPRQLEAYRRRWRRRQR
jgi:FkbM family methyltransferase